MAKTYILNPTPLLLIGNPKKRKRVKLNKSKSHGGEKQMSRKKSKKVSINPKRRHRKAIAVKSNPRRKRSRAIAVKSNPRRKRSRAIAVKSNPRRKRSRAIIVKSNPRRKRYHRNPGESAFLLEGLKFGGLVTIGMVGTSLIPQYALSAMNVKNEGIAKYGSEAVVGLGLAWASKLLKQDLEMPILAGAVAVILIQGLGDVISGIGNNMKISGYGYLPAQQVPAASSQIGAGNYGYIPPVNNVANEVYA